MAQSIKMQILFCMMTFLLLCNFSTLSAQDPFARGDSNRSAKTSGKEVFFFQKSDLPSSAEEEKEIYKKYSPVIVPKYFLLGIFREQFMGFRGNRIDYFFDFEMPLVNFLRDYIQQHFNIRVSIDEKKLDDGVMTLNFRSKELADLLNPLLTEVGNLDKELVNSEPKIYSYLLGAYYRNGFKLDRNLYYISGYNMNSVYFLLQEARCNNIVFLSPKYDVLVLETLSFEPSVYLKKYLDSFEKEKDELCKYGKIAPNKKSKTREIIKSLFNEWNNFIPPPLPDKLSK